MSGECSNTIALQKYNNVEKSGEWCSLTFLPPTTLLIMSIKCTVEIQLLMTQSENVNTKKSKQCFKFRLRPKSAMNKLKLWKCFTRGGGLTCPVIYRVENRIGKVVGWDKVVWRVVVVIVAQVKVGHTVTPWGKIQVKVIARQELQIGHNFLLCRRWIRIGRMDNSWEQTSQGNVKKWLHHMIMLHPMKCNAMWSTSCRISSLNIALKALK